jgi:Asp-tRNA(Asn)/Glu-tRNA(Gln) amidotransferase A subunit family amidase
MANSMDDIEVLTKHMIEFYHVDKTIPPVPWRTQLEPITKVGLLKEFGLFDLTTTNRRAMAQAVSILNRQGVEVVEIDMNDVICDLSKTIFACYMKNEILNNVISKKVDIGEELPPAFDGFKLLSKIPRFLLWISTNMTKNQKFKIMALGTLMSESKNRVFLSQKIQNYKSMFCERMNEKGVDVVLCPGMMPAIKHGTAANVNPWAGYTTLWNAFGFSAGSIPMTKVRADEQVYQSSMQTPFEDTVRSTMVGSEGLPVGIQVVAPGYKDEEVIEVMKMIAKGLKNDLPKFKDS